MRQFNPGLLKKKYAGLALAMESKGFEHLLPYEGIERLLLRRRGAMDDAHSIKVMIRDRGTFLFIRLPDHVYRILPGYDVAEVCVAALAGMSLDQSGLAREPSWGRDERAVVEARYASFGWRALAADDEKRAWAEFNHLLVDTCGGAGPDPAPSVTWDISAAYSEDRYSDTEPDLTRKLLEALRHCTPRGRVWLVFSDLIANVASFDPWQMGEEMYRTSWQYPILPRGDYPHFSHRTNHACFVSSDFRQGILTYLHEDSLCVFGRDLLAAVESRRPTLLATRRRQAHAVS